MKKIIQTLSVRFFFILIPTSLAIFGLTACTAKGPSNEVSLAIWGGYISPQTISRFESQTGIKVKITEYSSNEELLAKVQSIDGGVDLAVPSDYMVGIMQKIGLLAPLNMEQIPNRENILPQFLGQSFDPNNQFSLPYAWSTVGIAYNVGLVKNPPTSWKDLENPELSGKMSILDDVREAMALAHKINGHSVNSTDENEIMAAKQTLLKIKSNLKMFKSDTIEPLTKKEVAIAHAYSTSGISAEIKSSGEIKFILPKEGGTKAIDNLVIFKSSKNQANAHKLINFLLERQTNQEFVSTILGGPVIRGVQESLPENLKTHPALFPKAETLSRFEFLTDLGEKLSVYDRAWTEIKTY